MVRFGLIADLDQSKEIPLKSIEVTCQTKNTVACVSSKLTYVNNNDVDIEASFVFPMDEGAAVYHFEADMNGRRVVAECKKREEAHDIYERAIDSGKTAYLLEEDQYTGDIFKCHVGNLPPKTTAVLLIKYVAELKPTAIGDGKGSACQLVLPSVLNPRYDSTGRESSCRSATFTSSTKAAYDFRFSAEVSGSCPIAEVSSACDKFKVNYKNDSHTEAEVILTSEFNRDHDFTLDIRYAQPFEPYIFWEVGASSIDAKGPVFEPDLLMINFLPQLPDEQASTKFEFVFVVDCSGSMSGSKIDHTREAMMLFLKSLPIGCRFQLVRFGTSFNSFSRSSVDYTKRTLKEAVAYVKSHLNADMGGTEILQPLTSILKSEVTPGWRRIVFLLTDGEVGNVDQVTSLISQHSKESHVFTVGLGEGASTALVGGAARAGLGKAAYVKKNSELNATVIDLLRAAMSPRVSNLRIEWEGLPAGVQAITVPSSIPPLFSDQYLTVFSLLIGLTDELRSAGSASSRVLLTGQIDGISEPIRYELRLATINHRKDTEFSLRRLAAKYQIKEMTDRPAEEVDEAGIVLISTAANLVSKFTAFVGVDTESGKVVPGLVTKPEPKLLALSGFAGNVRCFKPSTGYMQKSQSLMPVSGSGSGLSSAFRKLGSVFSRSKKKEARRPVSAFGKASLQSRDEGEIADCLREEKKYVGAATNTHQGDSEQFSSISARLAGKQSFDGSWIPDKELAGLIGVDQESVKMETPDGVSSCLWWTAVVLAFLETRCDSEKSEWILIASKAKKWIIEKLKTVEKAEQMIASARALFVKTS